MQDNVTINGVVVEIIELFDEKALVQELISKEIYLIYLCEFDPTDGIGYNNNIEPEGRSNIISLKGWLKCQKTRKNKKHPLKRAQ